MPEKYHIETHPVPPRRPRIGRYGVLDWREDCSRCHNCVKKACIYDRHRQEMEYIRDLSDVDALFFDCMGCFSCVQDCTKGLLCMAVNPAYGRLGDDYWTPDIIRTTWLQAETAKIPVSGAGYGGRFTGPGFDAIWTDMSEIVRPTRDGIHGREYISTSVDIGAKPGWLDFTSPEPAALPPIVTSPMPLLIDSLPDGFYIPGFDEAALSAAGRTGVLSAVRQSVYPPGITDLRSHRKNIMLRLDGNDEPGGPDGLPEASVYELPDSPDVEERIQKLVNSRPEAVVSVRVPLDGAGVERTIELAGAGIPVIHAVADRNGAQRDVDDPRFIADMIREIHTSLVESGIRDRMTLIAGGGIALPEHLAKAIICGADLVSVSLPFLIALECHLCRECRPDISCPAKIGEADLEYAAGRMTNLIAAWHGQLIEVMGAMGMREVRRLRGETGRAMFFDEIEEETFGGLFGTRKQSR